MVFLLVENYSMTASALLLHRAENLLTNLSRKRSFLFSLRSVLDCREEDGVYVLLSYDSVL